MDEAIDQFFKKEPEVRPIFDYLEDAIQISCSDTVVKVQRSQIAFGSPKPYCWIWLPMRQGIKGKPPHYLIVSFGLDKELIHERLIGTVKPYPGRWTRHTILSDIAQIDPLLMGWIEQACRWKNSDGAASR